jgi:hypothetical protein
LYGGSRPQPTTLRKDCEGCALRDPPRVKSAHFGLAADGERRWCAECHGARKDAVDVREYATLVRLLVEAMAVEARVDAIENAARRREEGEATRTAAPRRRLQRRRLLRRPPPPVACEFLVAFPHAVGAPSIRFTLC